MKQLILIFALLVCMKSYGQGKFHRNYPINGDSTSINLGGLYMVDGSYLMVGGIQSKEGDISNLLFAKLDNKGDHVWSFKFNIDTIKGERFDYGNVGLTQTSTGDIYFMANLKGKPGAKKVMGALGANGIFGWSKFINLDSIDNEDIVFPIELATLTDSTIVQATTFTGQSVPILGVYNVKLQQYVAQRLLRVDQKTLSVNDIEIDTIKKLITVVGEIDNQEGYYVAGFDTNLQLLFSRKFSSAAPGLHNFMPKEVKILEDSSIVVVGRYFDLNVINIANSFFGSYVAKHDKTGALLWSKYINVNDSFPVNLSSINEDGITLALAGSYVNKTDLMSIPIMAAINKDGGQLWAQEYKRTKGLADYVGKAVRNTQTGGHVFFTNVIQNENDTIASLIKTDALGVSSCESPIVNPLFFDLALVTDTLLMEAVASTRIVDTESPKTRPIFDNFDIPVTKLAVTNFCPDVPILWVYRATTKGAVAYKWSTGETTDTIVVKDTEQYTVEITIDTNVCFTLCDTAKLGRFQKPKAAITVDQGQFCTTGLMTAGLNYTPGNSISTITWSSGQTNTPFVQVGAGNLSVTVVDECMESAKADTVIILPKLVSTVNITPNFGQFCTSSFGRLDGVADGPVISYSWSTGAKTQSTGISTPGNYSLTVSDICNNQKSQTITINQSNFPKVVNSVSIGQNLDEFCKTGNVILGALIDGEYESIKWSTGGTGETETVPGKAATYSVIVTDECKSLTEEITLEEIESICFKIPKLFFPDSNQAVEGNEDNRTLKLFTGNCGDLGGISNFEWHIFNRWGQEVYSTKNVNDEWDGQFSSKPAPPDSYVYYIKFKQGDCDLEKKGDVMLVR